MVSPGTHSAPGAWKGLTSREDFLRLSDERQFWLARCLRFWREGYAAAELDHADDYEAGYHDGLTAAKHIDHGIVSALHSARGADWGPGGREHFADPRPGDYMGGPVPWDSPTDLKRAM